MSHPKYHSKGTAVFLHLKPKGSSGNDTNIHIVTGNLPITKILFKVVGQNSKISKYQLFFFLKKKTNTSTKVLLSK